MIDMRTKFFAISSAVAFMLYPLAPDETLKKVPLGVGIVYILLTLLCGADSISRNAGKSK